MRVPLCYAVVDAADGKVATRLNVADPEVPGGRAGTSLWLFPETTRMQAAGELMVAGHVRAPVTEVCVRPARGRVRGGAARARSACGSSPADVKLRVSAERER
jgi:hypothetical protein